MNYEPQTNEEWVAYSSGLREGMFLQTGIITDGFRSLIDKPQLLDLEQLTPEMTPAFVYLMSACVMTLETMDSFEDRDLIDFANRIIELRNGAINGSIPEVNENGTPYTVQYTQSRVMEYYKSDIEEDD